MIVKRNRTTLEVVNREPDYRYSVEMREPALGIIIAMTPDEALSLADRIIVAASKTDPAKALDRTEDIAERLEGVD